jgi:hypothetical protein
MWPFLLPEAARMAGSVAEVIRSARPGQRGPFHPDYRVRSQATITSNTNSTNASVTRERGIPLIPVLRADDPGDAGAGSA